MPNDFDFEISDFLYNGIATIPLTDSCFDEDLSIGLINSSCATSILFDFSSTTSLHLTLNSFKISSSYPCKIGFKGEGRTLNIENFYTNKISLDSTFTFMKVKNLKMIGHSVDTYLPQVSVEALIEVTPDPNILSLRLLIQSVNILPGSGEYVYDPAILGCGSDGIADSLRSILQLKEDCPAAKWVSPIVTWFGLSKDAGECKILPAVAFNDMAKEREDYPWRVQNFQRMTAYEISRDSDGRPSYGGTTNDASVVRYLEALKDNGFEIMLYPMIFLDLPGKPWRGYITGTPSEVEWFFNNPDGYNNFILHYVNLAKGKIDAFVIGSELGDLTKIKDASGNFIAVKELVKLARAVKAILGPSVKITYGANWHEYHHTDGGYHNLDELWACEAIDVVGIDAYFPITNRTSGEITIEEIKHGWLSGEGYDFYIDHSDGDKKCALAPDYAWKNIRHWWESEHFDPGGIKTPWVPKMKEIWFTEMGFPSIHYASNQPNVFYNPKCVDGGLPINSSGAVDFEIQKRALRASLELWEGSECVRNIFIWALDARPYPAFPDRLDLWSDGDAWEKGHWISGKLKSEVKVRGRPECSNLSLIGASCVFIED